MTSHVCPACGYPTLKPALCAFCCPGEVFSGNNIFGAPLIPTMARESTWAGAGGADLVTQGPVWSGLAS